MFRLGDKGKGKGYFLLREETLQVQYCPYTNNEVMACGSWCPLFDFSMAPEGAVVALNCGSGTLRFIATTSATDTM